MLRAYERFGTYFAGFLWGAAALFTVFIGPRLGVALWGVASFGSETWGALGFQLITQFWALQAGIALVLLAHECVGWWMGWITLRRTRVLGFALVAVLSVLVLAWGLPALRHGVEPRSSESTDLPAPKMVSQQAVFQSGSALYIGVAWAHLGLVGWLHAGSVGRNRFLGSLDS